MSRIWVKRMLAAVAATACVLTLVSCAKTVQGVETPDGKIKLTVGEYGVTETEYDYYLKNYRLTDGLDVDAANDAALADVKRNCAVLSMAAEYGVELTKEERAELENNVKVEAENIGGDAAFDSGLEKYNMTRGLYMYLMQVGKLETLLREYVTDERSGAIKSDDKTVENDINNNFLCVKQILISNDQGDDVEANRALANEIRDRVLAGGDFDALVAEYNEDENMDPVHGRYFTHGMFPQEFEDAARETLVGSYFGVIETSVGFHIIERMPIDPEYVDKNFEQLRYYYLTRVFNEMLEERMDSLEVVWEK